jgi:hypothetical protein
VTAGTVVEPVPRKPIWAEAPALREPFQDRLRTVTVEPLVVRVPFQSWVMVLPLGWVQLIVQPLMAELPAVMVRVTWKPPFHELMTW